MPEGVKDLPDPLDQPARSVEQSPDDLLSKMADDAISKLMEDSDRGITNISAPAPIEESVDNIVESEPIAPVAETPVAPEPIESAVVAESTRPADLDADAPAEPKPVVSEPATENVQAQLDSVLSEMTTPAAAPIPVPTPTPDPVPAAPQPIHAPEASAPDSRADMKALFETPAPTAHADAPAAIVKPLEWLNAPFSKVPDEIRDVLGQIGIITLINALAVLLYVILFRTP